MTDLNHASSLSRRDFCRLSATALAAGMTAGLARHEIKAADFPAGRYVDVHTHLGRTWNTTVDLSADNLLRWMDENDIAQAVVLPLVSPESSSFPLTSDFVLAQTKPHRDRLIPFCSIDPRTSYTGGHKTLVEMLKSYVEQGAKGFGEHKPGVRIDDPRNMALYAALAELKLPLLFHIDTERNIDEPGLPGLEKALKAFADVPFIGHATGWWNSISGDVKEAKDLGGYPKTPVVTGGAVDRLFETYPNLYGDLSAGSGAGAITRDLKFGREFLIRRADRLMFGTDYLSPGQNVPQLELYRQLDLPQDVQEKIFRNNARKVLQLG